MAALGLKLTFTLSERNDVIVLRPCIWTSSYSESRLLIEADSESFRVSVEAIESIKFELESSMSKSCSFPRTVLVYWGKVWGRVNSEMIEGWFTAERDRKSTSTFLGLNRGSHFC